MTGSTGSVRLSPATSAAAKSCSVPSLRTVFATVSVLVLDGWAGQSGVVIVSVRVMVAPVIPGLTDHEIPTVLAAAAEAGMTLIQPVEVSAPAGDLASRKRFAGLLWDLLHSLWLEELQVVRGSSRWAEAGRRAA